MHCELDISSYLKLDDLQECGVNMEWHGELALSDLEDDVSLDFHEKHVISRHILQPRSMHMPSMIHTQPVHLIHVHNLKSLQTSFEEEDEQRIICSSSTPPSLADTRHSSVFSSTRSINVLLEEDEQDLDSDLQCMAPVKKKQQRALVAPIMFSSSSSKKDSVVSEKDQFVYTLTNKLLPYFGYFLADSNDLDYFDKIRFQEIDYKFSKTYF
ncbi:Ime1 [Kluyveromyces lactis]|nr:Ime1 [Kluyveromyces lactis]